MTAVEKNTVTEIATPAALTLEIGQATTWFVPPVVVPAFLLALIVARVAYQALI
jgi:hypothetical protein